MPVETSRTRPRTRKSLRDFEMAFRAEAIRERERLAQLRRDSQARAKRRQAIRIRRSGSVRFGLLVASMILTAVVVTVVMLNTLAWLLG